MAMSPQDVAGAAQQAASGQNGPMSAQTAREVSVMLSANTGSYQKEMQPAVKATEQFANAIEKADQQYKRLFKTMGRSAIGAGGAMQAMATGATWAAASFEESFARVAKTTGLTNTVGGQTGTGADLAAAFGMGEGFGIGNDELQQFENDIRRLSTVLPVSTGELSHLADVAGQLGVESENLTHFADTAAKLGAGISGLSSDVAIAGLANLSGAFGLAEKEVHRLGSSLAELANHTRGNADEMLYFSRRLAGSAVQMGITADEVLGLGAAISAVGQMPERGASAIDQTLTRINLALQEGGDEADRFAQAMGSTSSEMQKMWSEQGGTAVLMQLLKTLSTQGDEASVTLQKLGLAGVGTTQVLSAMSAQIGVVQDALGKSSDAFDDGTAVAELAAVRFDTLTKKIQQFQQSTSEVFRSMGVGTLVLIKPLVDMMTRIVNIFNDLPQTLKTAMGMVAGLGGVALVAAGSFTVFYAGVHAFFMAARLLIPIIQAAITALRSMGTAASVNAAKNLSTLSTTLQAVTGAASGMAAAFLAAGRAMKTAAVSSFTVAWSGLLAVIYQSERALRGATKWIAVEAWHEWKYALGLTAKAFKQLGKAAASAMWTVGKALAPMLLIMGAMTIASKVWGAMKTDVDELTSSLEKTAEAAGLVLETVEEIAKLEIGNKDSLNFMVESEDLLNLLDRLDEDERREHLIQYGMQLLRSGNDPEDVKRTIEDLGLMASTPIEFNYTLSSIMNEDFDKALDGAKDSVDRAIKGIEATVGERIFGYGGILGRTPESTAQYIQEFQATLDQLKSASGNNAAAGIANYLQVAHDLDQAFQEGQISAEKYDASLAMLDDTFKNIPKIGNLRDLLVEDQAVREIHMLDQSFNSARASLIELMDTPLNNPLGRKIQNAIRDAVGPTEDLNRAIVDLSDADMSNLLDQLRDLAIDENVQKTIDAIDSLDTELARRMEMPALQGMSEEHTKRYWDQLKTSIPSEFGLGDAIRQADHELQKLMDTGIPEKMWGDKADRYRQLLDEWTQGFIEMQVPSLVDELQAADANDQVRLLGKELRALGDIPTDIKIKIQRTVLQETYQRESQGFRQEMSEYDGMMKRREQLEEDHSKRLAEMVENRNKSIADLRENHAERLEEINEREKEALEEKVKAQADAFDATEKLESQHAQSAARLLANMERQNRAMASAQQGLAQLQNMGLSTDAIEALGLNDPKNVDQIERFVQDAMANPALIEEINSTWGQRLNLSKAFVDTDETDKIKEDFDKQRKDAEESFSDQLANINESHAESVAQATESYQEQMGDIGEALDELGRETADTLEELIDRAMNSGIEGLEEWARHVQHLKKSIDSFGGANVPRGVSREDISPLDTEQTAPMWDALKEMASDTWTAIKEDVESESSKAMVLMEGIFGSGTASALDAMIGAFDNENDEFKNAGVNLGNTFVMGFDEAKDSFSESLTEWYDGLKEAHDEHQQWVEEQESENPTVPYPGGSADRSSQYREFAMASGGFLPDEATIAKGGTLVQWAEPETGGEAFIPLAPGKRERSREIWLKTGQMLGMMDSYARGGIRGREPMGTGVGQGDIVKALVTALETSGPRESNTNYGPIEVKANDPRQLAKQLEQRRRRQRLTEAGRRRSE